MQIKNLDSTDTIIVSVQYGDRHYPNSNAGRAWLAAECPPEIVAEVMEVWGDTPTVPDELPPDEPPTPPTATLMERTAALESAVLAMLGDSRPQGGDGNV